MPCGFRFNPITPTTLTSALKALLAKAGATVSQTMLTAIVDGANGDIRSAIMRLEFACAKTSSGESRQRDKCVDIFYLIVLSLTHYSIDC